MFFVVFTGASGAAFALPASCDSDFMDVMEARATIEGQREVEMAATLMLKPDSVLAMSCFDKELTTLNFAARSMLSANTGARLFDVPPSYFMPEDLFQPGNFLYMYKGEGVHPDTPYRQGNENRPLTSPQGPAPNSSYNEGIWEFSYPPFAYDNPVQIPGREHFSGILQIMIRNSLIDYFYNNFDYNYLGGSGKDKTDCATMQVIWDFARCDNFDKVDFYTFDQIRSNDPRKLPQACGSGRMDWNVAIKAANPEPDKSGALKKVQSFLKHIDHDIAKGCEDSLVVETGVTVYTYLADEDPVAEKVCSLPGCSYVDDECQE